MLPSTHINVIIRRGIHLDQVAWAGMQGGGNISMVMRTKQIERKRRLIRKMEKLPAKKIPVLDFDIKPEWKEKSRQRKIKLSEEEQEERTMLLKTWTTYALFKKMEEEQKVKRLMTRQTKALQELEKISPHLYYEAIKADPSHIEFTCRGPVQSLPRANYKAPLGGFLSKAPPHSTDAD